MPKSGIIKKPSMKEGDEYLLKCPLCKGFLWLQVVTFNNEMTLKITNPKKD